MARMNDQTPQPASAKASAADAVGERPGELGDDRAPDPEAGLEVGERHARQPLEEQVDDHRLEDQGDVGTRRAEGGGEQRSADEDRQAEDAAPAELHPQEIAERDRAQPDHVARQAEIAHRGEEQEERLRPVAQAPVGGRDQAPQREVGEQDRRHPHELGESRGAARTQQAAGSVERLGRRMDESRVDGWDG